MQAFVDTEFIETPAGPQLLSCGFCLADGRELYLEREDAEVTGLSAAYPSGFLQAHVINQLGRIPEARASLDDIARRLSAWVDGLGCAELEVVYDYNADFLLIEQLMARMSHPPQTRLVPTHVAYFLEDPEGMLAAEQSWAATEASRGLRRHHALADSLALAARFRAVHRV